MAPVAIAKARRVFPWVGAFVLFLALMVHTGNAQPLGLYGIHDAEPAPTEYLNHIRPSGGGWITATVAIGYNPSDTSGNDFSGLTNGGHTVICRINNGYFPNGTIPLTNDYDNFAARCSNFVAHSRGCNIWVIGNECNLSSEWPFDGTKFAYVSPQVTPGVFGRFTMRSKRCGRRTKSYLSRRPRLPALLEPARSTATPRMPTRSTGCNT